MELKAVIFDLDGVITDTAEYHYLAWQRLADEEGLAFSRDANEQLRGVSRRDSLLFILGERRDETSEEQLQAMMARKNGYYVEMLSRVTAADLLPGIPQLLDELDLAGIPYALASASRNARKVVELLGIANRLAFIADGNSVSRPKPFADIFRFAAAHLGVAPHECIVIEDAAAGVKAAQAAGMASLAVGPDDRFGALLINDARVGCVDDMSAVKLSQLQLLVAEDPMWHVSESSFNPTQLHHKETVFTTGNGYFSSRGTFEEGYPGESSITFAHGVFDDMPVSFTELANLPKWLDLAISIDNHEFKLSEGKILDFYRFLDLQRGVLRRVVRWEAPAGAIVDLSFERFIAYANEHVAAVRFLATAVNRPCHLHVATGLDGHVSNQDLLHWRLGQQGQESNGTIWLEAETRHSKIKLAAAVSVTTSAPSGSYCESCPGHPRLMMQQTVQVGETMQVDKLVSYAFSRDRSPGQPLVRALGALREQSFERLKTAHVAAWAARWEVSDVLIEGDERMQRAIRFNLFQLFVAAPQTDDRVSIGAKTLSGYGYRGHVFWDTEIFILPFFVFTQPDFARRLLTYRFNTLSGARQKATENGFRGAQFAWESAATGREVTPTWVPHFSDPKQLVRIWTGDIQIHITADIAYAIMQYWRATGDDRFICDYGAEIILDGARFWADRAEREEIGSGVQFSFRDVIGPDEYHDHVDNNAFTNYMARWHLATALDVIEWLQRTEPAKAAALTEKLSLSEVDLTKWRFVHDHIAFKVDEETGLIHQFEDFFERKVIEPLFVANAAKSLQVILGIEGANESQVLKQADVIMLMCLFRDRFSAQQWQTNWDAYMPITDHRYGSSLGPAMHAWAACEMGRPEEAYEHFSLAALVDLENPRGNAGDGIHAASAGGVWQAVVFGFAGLRLNDSDVGFTISPKLPSHWRRLSFKVQIHGQQHMIDIQA